MKKYECVKKILSSSFFAFHNAIYPAKLVIYSAVGNSVICAWILHCYVLLSISINRKPDNMCENIILDKVLSVMFYHQSQQILRWIICVKKDFETFQCYSEVRTM